MWLFLFDDTVSAEVFPLPILDALAFSLAVALGSASLKLSTGPLKATPSVATGGVKRLVISAASATLKVLLLWLVLALWSVTETLKEAPLSSSAWLYSSNTPNPLPLAPL